MPEQFLTDVFQPQDPSGTWGLDPVLMMALSFVIVPIAIAILVLILGVLGRFLRGDGSHHSTTRPAENRLKMVEQFQTTARLEGRRRMAPRPDEHTVCSLRPRDRQRARRTRDRRLHRRELPRSASPNIKRIALRAYKRSPAIDNSSWHKGMLLSRLAGPADNDGAFDLVVSRMVEGAEPPPHVHSREDELFYVLCGELRAYVAGEVFTLTAGECIFLPRRIPHALIVASGEARMVALITPGGYADAFNRTIAPAQRMEVPTASDIVSFAKADLGETTKVFEEYGVRLLTPDEILSAMPRYPR